MKSLLVIGGLLLASPAWSQTKVYTNADIGQRLSSTRPTVSPEVLASLAAHQYHVPIRPSGPQWVSSGLQPTMGPFAAYQTDALVPRRLDGSLYSDPPWQAVAYLPWFYAPYASPSYYPPSYGPRRPAHARPRPAGGRPRSTRAR